MKKELSGLQKRLRILTGKKQFLELETGIDGVMNFLFDFNENGALTYAPIDTLMEQIRESRK